MRTIEVGLQAKGLRVAIVVSRFNDVVTSRLLAGAQDGLLRHGALEDDIETFRVPGAFELPLMAQRVAMAKKHDGLICLGAIIRGDTPHFDYLCPEVARGISSVALTSGVPVAFGVLTTDTLEQALERAGSKAGNKGSEAAQSVIEMINLLRKVNEDTRPETFR